MLRITTVALGLVLFWSSARASTILLRVEPHAVPVPAGVGTFGGPVEVTTAIVRPSTSVTVIWLVDTFDDEYLQAARNDLLSLERKLPGRSLRLFVLRGSEVENLGIVSNGVVFKKKIEAIDLQPAVAGASMPADHILPALDGLYQNIPELGSKWSSLVVVGRGLNLQPAVAEYASALLARAMNAQQIRVFLRMEAAEPPEQFVTLANSTGGATFQDSSELPALLDERRQSFLTVSWTTPQPPLGFVITPAVVKDDDAKALITTFDFADQGAPPVSIETVAAQQAKLGEVAKLMEQQQLDAATLNSIRSGLEEARQINPADPVLLRLQAGYFEQTKAYPEEVKSASLLTQVQAENGAAFVLLGHAQLRLGSVDDAEKSLIHAGELGVHPDLIAEDLARVHLARKDDSGAIPYLQAALVAAPKRQDLWFVLGETAERARQNALAIQAFEEGLALGGTHVQESGALVRLYLATAQPAKARTFALQTIQGLPSQLAPRIQFAQALDQTSLREEALKGWQSVVAVGNDQELPHVRIARLLLELGRPQDALDASSDDINQFPKSPELYLVKADALRAMHRDYEMHSALQEGVAATDNLDVLSRLASVQDWYGFGSAETYAALAHKLDSSSPEMTATLERGCFVAIRDNELERAGDFARSLGASSKCQRLIGSSRSLDDTLLIPGGMDALAQMAGMKQGVGPDQFLLEYARALEADNCGSCRNDPFRARIQGYFETVAELEALGIRNGNNVTINIAASDSRSMKRAEAVFKLLGLGVSTHGGVLKIEMGAGQNKASRQEFMAALGIDEVGLSNALEANKPYSITITDEAAGVYPSITFWKNLTPASARGNLLVALLNSQRLTRIYTALGSMDRHTVNTLTQAVDLSKLSEEGVDLLFTYGSCFAVQGSSAALPGGPAARAVWVRMIGSLPDSPGEFFRSLLQRSDPMPLAFFFEMSQIDPAHQAFATANYERLHRLYGAFLAMHSAHGNVSAFVNQASFAQLLQSIPLDKTGHLAFPGSIEVWTVAKGDVVDNAKFSKMMKKMGTSPSPDEEDNVLVRLADTQYRMNQVRHTELDNFLAVAHVDAHRKVPLDERSALLLAQQYANAWPIYPYFSDLPALAEGDFRSFFTLLDSLKQLPDIEQNVALGEVHSLVELVVILHRRQVIDDTTAAKLFSAIATKLQANDGAARTAGALETARSIVSACRGASATDVDDALKTCLLGAEGDPWVQMRRRDYGMVLDAQKVPSLAALLSLKKNLDDIAELKVVGDKAREAAESVAKLASALPSVAIPKQMKVDGREHEAITRYAPDQIQKRAQELRGEVAKRKPSVKSLQKQSADMIKDLEGQVTLALAGPLYGYFLRASDLVVSEDSLLLRKHRYYDFDEHTGHAPEIEEAEFVKRSEGAGSYFKGGLAQFSVASGNAAAVGWSSAGSGTEWAIAAQIASIRSTRWEALHEADERLAALRILAAREWIVAAAQDNTALQRLSDRFAGVLSLRRRAALLTGIQDRDWKRVWSSVFIPDLFMIGGDLEQTQATWLDTSPVLIELKRVAGLAHESGINDFGRVPYSVYGCAHPHVVPDRPYEAYESEPLELGERVADFKLFLAYRADSLGITPKDLGRIAEPLASRAFKSVKMANFGDWRSLLDAYSSIDKKQFVEALDQ